MAARLAQTARSPAPAGHPVVYDIFVAVHVSLALVGFGAVALSGAYGIVGRSGLSRELARFISGRTWAEFSLVAAPLFGVAAMAVRPGGSEFSQLWAIGGLTIWVVAAVLLVCVLRPAEARLRAAVARISPSSPAAAGPCDLDEESPEADRPEPGKEGCHAITLDTDVRVHATRIAWAGALSDLLFLAALMLMVTQPARL